MGVLGCQFLGTSGVLVGQQYPLTPLPLDTHYPLVYNRYMRTGNKYKLDVGDLVWNEKNNLYGVVTDINKFSNKCEITWIGEKKRPKTRQHRWVDSEVSKFKKVSDD